MNNYIPSGTSLFDVLSMIIPGSMIFYIIVFLSDWFSVCYIEINNIGIGFYLIVMVTSYLLGMIWNMIMDWMFVGFRNDEEGIGIGRNKCINKEFSSNKIGGIYKFKMVYRIISRKKQKGEIMNRYYDAYYQVAKSSVGNVISIIETQVVFIRNLLLLIFIYGVRLFFEDQGILLNLFNCSRPKVVGIALILLSILMFCTIVSRQQKIYDRVWEEFYKKGNNSLFL